MGLLIPTNGSLLVVHTLALFPLGLELNTPTSPLAHWLLALSYWQLRILEISTNRFFCRPTKVENFVLMPSGKSPNMLRTRF